MVSLYRAFWSIPNAGPSLSTMWSTSVSPSEAQGFADAVRAYFFAVNSVLPNDVSITFDTEVINLDDETGTLVGVDAVTPGAQVPGTQTGNWAAGAGLRCVWATDGIVAGRRVRGATFLVPAASTALSASGTPASAAFTAVNTAASTYLASMAANGTPAAVWSRPATGRPGSVHIIQGGSLSPLTATLRNRKY